MLGSLTIKHYFNLQHPFILEQLTVDGGIMDYFYFYAFLVIFKFSAHPVKKISAFSFMAFAGFDVIWE